MYSDELECCHDRMLPFQLKNGFGHFCGASNKKPPNFPFVFAVVQRTYSCLDKVYDFIHHWLFWIFISFNNVSFKNNLLSFSHLGPCKATTKHTHLHSEEWWTP